MAERAARVHSYAAIDDRPEVESDLVVVDIRQVDVESLRLDVLGVQCRAFERCVGLRRPIHAQYLEFVTAISAMQDKQKVHQTGINQLRFVGAKVTTGPREPLHGVHTIGAVPKISILEMLAGMHEDHIYPT